MINLQIKKRHLFLFMLALAIVFGIPLALAWTNPTQAPPNGNLSVVPSGAVMFMNATSCPTGWTEFTEARGRHLVGLPSGGTLAGVLGSAMADLQNPSVTPAFTGSALGTHQHKLGFGTANNNTMVTVEGGKYGVSGTVGHNRSFTISTNTDGGYSEHLSEGVSAGTPAGTVSAVTASSVAPYVQLLVCRKL